MLSWVSVCPPVSMKVFVTALAIAAESPCLSSPSSTPIGFTSSLSSSVPFCCLLCGKRVGRSQKSKGINSLAIHTPVSSTVPFVDFYISSWYKSESKKRPCLIRSPQGTGQRYHTVSERAVPQRPPAQETDSIPPLGTCTLTPLRESLFKIQFLLPCTRPPVSL